MTDRWLLRILACPGCGGHPLTLDATNSDGERIHAGRLNCEACGRSFGIEDGIAALLPDGLDRALATPDGGWSRWRDRLGEFLTWRERAWGTRDAAQRQRAHRRTMHRAFVEFCHLDAAGADLLDIGCGTGHLCDLISGECRYVGVDPLPAGRDPELRSLPAHMPRPQQEFRMVQAVGECLPFCDETFDVVVAMGSLDHCNDPGAVMTQAYRVLRPGGLLGILQGLSNSAAPRHAGKRLLRLLAALASCGMGAPCAAATHGHAFTTEALTELVGRHFERCQSRSVGGRLFLTARKPAESEADA